MMKSGLVIVGLLFACHFAGAQGNYPPTNLIQSFNREYPKSEHAVWDNGKAGWYVRFKNADHQNAAVFYDKTGKRYETQVLCDTILLPAPVREHIQKKYPDIKQIEYARIDHPGKKSFYMAQFKQTDQLKTVYLNADGREINSHENMIALPAVIEQKSS
jgi:hypothetical protein